MNLKVTITKTSNGLCDYIQVMSEDMITVNVVLVAAQIEVVDMRPERAVKRKAKKQPGR